MSLITARAHHATIARAFDQLEIQLPKAYTTDVADAAKLRGISIGGQAAAGALNAAVIRCIRAGTDYHDDPEVKRLITEVTIGSVGFEHAAQQATQNVLAEAVSQHTDTLLAALHTATLEDADILARVGPDLSDISDISQASANDLRARGQLAAWGEALGAVERFNIAETAAAAILAASGYPIPTDLRPLALAEATIHDIDYCQQNKAGSTTWTLVRNGAKPEVIDSMAALIKRVETVEQQRQKKEGERAEQRPAFDPSKMPGAVRIPAGAGRVTSGH